MEGRFPKMWGGDIKSRGEKGEGGTNPLENGTGTYSGSLIRRKQFADSELTEYISDNKGLPLQPPSHTESHHVCTVCFSEAGGGGGRRRRQSQP